MPLHHAHWPPRLPWDLQAPKTSLWFNLEISALRYPDKAALVFMDRSWSYKVLADQALALARSLYRLGVKRSDRVLLDMQNCPQFVIAFFGSPE